jgi:integrase
VATIKKRILPSGLIRWQVDFADAGGKRRAKLFERRKEADQFLVKVRPQVLAGTYVHDSVSITVGEAADAWLAHCRVRRDAGRRMERTTYVGYEGFVRCHIKDEKVGIGDLKLSRLSRKAVNDFRDKLLESGRSEMITRKILGALRLVLNHAIDNGQVHANAAQGVRVLRSSRLDYKVWRPLPRPRRFDRARSNGRPAATLSADARSSPFPWPLRPHPREASDLRDGTQIPKDRRPRRLRAR